MAKLKIVMPYGRDEAEDKTIQVFLVPASAKGAVSVMVQPGDDEPSKEHRDSLYLVTIYPDLSIRRHPSAINDDSKAAGAQSDDDGRCLLHPDDPAYEE